MSRSARALLQVVRRMTKASLFAAFVGASGAAFLGLLLLRPLQGSAWKLVGGVAISFVLVSMWRLMVDARRTVVLRKLSEGTLPVERGALLRGLIELTSLPDESFLTNLMNFLAGGAVAGLIYKFWAGGTWSFGFQIILIALTLGSVASLYGYVLLVPQARRGIALLLELGLTDVDVAAELSRRSGSVRRRIIVFSAVGALAPSVLIAQLYLSRTDLVLDAAIAGTVTFGGAAQLGLPGGGLTALFIGWVLLIGHLGVGHLTGPMREIADQAKAIAAGDLRPRPLVLAGDEVASASAEFLQMRLQLLSAIAELQGAGVKISNATDTLVKTSDEHGDGTQKQVQSLNVTSVTTEELARSAHEIANRAASVAEIAKTTLRVALSGQATAEAFFGSMDRMRQDNHRIADAVVKLNKRVQQIGKIVEFINEIADKSDLLALNAELEGTKAGDIGRGFSLVAAEMRRLAVSVMSSTREIDALINDIRDATNAAVMATEAGVKATDAGAAISQEVAQSLKTIVDLARQTADAVQTISLATQQQQTGTGQLAEAMASVLTVTQQGAVATQQMTATNAGLSGLAQELKAVVNRFRTN